METVYPKTLILGLWMSTLLVSCATFRHAPNPSRFVLPQGTVLLVEENPTTPLVSVSLFVRGGSFHEKIPGTAHLLEHLLFRTGHEDSLNYSQQIHHFGGSTFAQTGYDYTHYTQIVPKESFAVTLTLLIQHLSNFECTSELITEEKPVLLTEIQSRLDRPDLKLTDRLLESVLNASAPYYSSPAGTPASIDSLTSHSLQTFFQKGYSPSNWVISIAGNVQAEAIFAQVQQLLSAFPRKKRIPVPPIPKQRPGWNWTEEPSSDFRMGSALLLPGFSHPDRPALLVAERYLEWFLREYLLHDFQLKTSVDISSFYLRSAGVMVLRLSGGESSWVTPEFLRGLKAVRQQSPAPQLVEMIKHFLLLQHEKKIEDFHQTSFALGEAEVMGNYRYFTEFPQHLSRVTAKEVQYVLQHYLSQENIHTLLWTPNPSGKKFSEFEEISPRPDPKQILLASIRKKKMVGTTRLANESEIAETQHSSTLPNGLKIILRRRPGSPVNSVGLFFKAGTAFETNHSEGGASLLETYLESRIYDGVADELRRNMARLGGDFQWKLTPDLMWAEGTLLPDQTVEAIQFLAKAFQSPRREDRVSWERLQQEQSLKCKMESELLSQQGKQSLFPLLFPKHPYGKGKNNFCLDPSFATLNLESLQLFYKTCFSLDRASVVVVGDFEEEVLLKEIQQCFSAWPVSSVHVPSIPEVPFLQSHTPIETRPTSFGQSFLFLGAPVCAFGETDHLPLLVLQGILTHRLFQQLVYKKSMAYQTLALGDFYAAGGFLGVSVLTSPTQDALAKIQLHDIIATLTQKEVPFEELQQVKKQLLVSQQIHYRTGRNLLQGLGVISLLPKTPPSHLQEILEQVTSQEILRLTQKYFSSQQLILLHLKGNASK